MKAEIIQMAMAPSKWGKWFFLKGSAKNYLTASTTPTKLKFDALSCVRH